MPVAELERLTVPMGGLLETKELAEPMSMVFQAPDKNMRDSKGSLKCGTHFA
jgi:hypothetical protein